MRFRINFFSVIGGLVLTLIIILMFSLVSTASFSEADQTYSNKASLFFNYYNNKNFNYIYKFKKENKLNVIEHKSRQDFKINEEENEEIMKIFYRITYDKETQIEKILAIYDYINNLPYKETNGIQELIKTLKYGGDCNDKAVLFSYFMNIINVENFIVETTHKNNISHSYNIVKIYNKWYAFDTTKTLFTDFNENIRYLYNNKIIYLVK